MRPPVFIMNMPIAPLTQSELIAHLFEKLDKQEGGWLITANLDFLKRYADDSSVRQLYRKADLMIADGMPLLWASQLLGSPLPERVAGSELIAPLAQQAAAKNRTLFLLGGQPGSAEKAQAVLCQAYPNLQIVGTSCPWFSVPPTQEEVAASQALLTQLKPDIVLVGLGSPKQEYVIDALRPYLPSTWFIGVGVSFSFLAGDLAQAPQMVKRLGLEWVHRMVQEPKRLTKRYLIDDLPFFGKLMLKSTLTRLKEKSRRN